MVSATLCLRDDVPAVFREHGIYTGYRKPNGLWQDYVRSAFSWNNETLNFWTHFAGLCYFGSLLVMYLLDKNFREDPYHWPFLALLFTMCLCPMSSCLAHLFCMMSERMRHTLFFVDYLCISLCSFGLGNAFHAYSFDGNFLTTRYAQAFPYLNGVSAMFCTYLACSSRTLESGAARKAIRVFSFVVPYLVIMLPILERVVHCKYWPNDTCVSEYAALEQHMQHVVWAVVCILIYGLHIPESLAPGYFDIVGHSHQIFHVITMLTSRMQIWACFQDMNTRRTLIESSHVFTGEQDLRLVSNVIMFDCAITLYFIRRIWTQCQAGDKEA